MVSEVRLANADEIGQRMDSMAEHMAEILTHLGLDPTSEHLSRTPERFVNYLLAYRQPVDIEALLKSGFEDDDPTEVELKKSVVVQTDIPFFGMCAHHLLPFFGKAAVGYVPRARVVGLSKLTRLVYAAGHIEPTTQEWITNKVADALYNSTINPKGVAVISSALHGCMSARGVESPSTRTTISAIRGVFYDEPGLETKFMTLAMEGLR